MFRCNRCEVFWCNNNKIQHPKLKNGQNYLDNKTEVIRIYHFSTGHSPDMRCLHILRSLWKLRHFSPTQRYICLLFVQEQQKIDAVSFWALVNAIFLSSYNKHTRLVGQYIRKLYFSVNFVIEDSWSFISIIKLFGANLSYIEFYILKRM